MSQLYENWMGEGNIFPRGGSSKSTGRSESLCLREARLRAGAELGNGGREQDGGREYVAHFASWIVGFNFVVNTISNYKSFMQERT